MNNTIKWTGAIVLSLLAHAGAAQLFSPAEKPPELDLVQGGEEMEVAVLGNAFADTLQAGDPDEEIEPAEITPEEVEPTPVEVADVAPVPSEVPTETPTDIVPTEADVILPAEEMPPVAAEQPEITATVAAAETVIPEEKPEPEKIVEPLPEKKPEPKEKPQKEKPKKKVVKKQAGESGKQQESAQKGQADGTENASATNAQGKKGAVSRQAGNANFSNYNGKVRAKLSRARRYPPSARRERIQGIVTVRFVVSGNGSASGVSVVGSSGSSVLDSAAIEAVHRAAPFPDTPDGNSKLFVIPIDYTF
ncbi:TonB family protein [Pararhizobium sp. BT-229]|uniref:energy transducer TonB n=1 Tax=Pararhizobium sp. BT-229 TaxID=2986923 RepID=UPI0021F77D64|nr:TonB family protein [Pararhizobium sp. BT-229]MCV9961458.1 TonB family protein [Pararhizobium sp. BT-229]